MRVQVLAPAKINLALDIVGKREDGYHLVDMVMQALDLCDVVTVSCQPKKEINVSCDYPLNVAVEKNTAYRAAAAFFRHLGTMTCGVEIFINKKIPAAAGLAGGSTDAAATLVALNHIFTAGYSQAKLAEIGAEIGADVPFCVFGGTMLASGIGTTLNPIKSLPACHFVLAKPPISVSTKEAYARADGAHFSKEFSVEKTVAAIASQDSKQISSAVFNRFEEVMGLEDVQKIKREMLGMGAAYSCMSGSGPTVFGAFEEEKNARACAGALKSEYCDVFVCRPLAHGCKII